MYLDKDPEAISNFIHDHHHLMVKEYVAACLHTEVYHKFSDKAQIVHQKFLPRASFLVSPREMYYLQVKVHNAEEGLFANVACTIDPGFPPPEGTVRVNCPYMITHLERSEEDPNRTHFSYCYDMDFGGNMPKAMKDFMNVKRVRTMEKMKPSLLSLTL